MTAPIILADLADLCTGLADKANAMGAEAKIALDEDDDIALARRINDRALGIMDAVTAILAFITARAEKAL